MSAETPPPAAPRAHRDVVSFVRRGNRLSRSRQQAWDRGAERWVLDVPIGERDTLPDPAARLDPEQVFGRRAPLVVEIGSGQGENIAAAAAAHPERDHLAFEVYRPGLAQCLDRLERAGSPGNIRLVGLDALGSLGTLLPDASITETWIFFPDPWHKSRHHKRRLVNPPLLAILHRLLVPGGVLRLATDWAEYAEHMRSVLDANPGWETLHPDGWAPRFEGRVITSFERKATEAGRTVHDLAYRRADGVGTNGAGTAARTGAAPSPETEEEAR